MSDHNISTALLHLDMGYFVKTSKICMGSKVVSLPNAIFPLNKPFLSPHTVRIVVTLSQTDMSSSSQSTTFWLVSSECIKLYSMSLYLKMGCIPYSVVAKENVSVPKRYLTPLTRYLTPCVLLCCIILSVIYERFIFWMSKFIKYTARQNKRTIKW